MITSQANGNIGNSPVTLIASGNPNSRLVKGIIVSNLDTINHTLHLEVGSTLVKVILHPDDSLHFNSTVALGLDNLVGYVDEAIVTNDLQYVVTYLDENETV
jgi:hypothetical protein